MAAVPVTEEYFISLVETNRLLWDKSHKEYRNTKLKEKIWADIGNDCNLSGPEATGLFNSIRLKYVRRKNDLKQLSRNGSSAKILKPWSLFDRLKFLDDTIIPRKTVSSILNKSAEPKQPVTEISYYRQNEASPENSVVEFLNIEVDEADDYKRMLSLDDPLMSPTSSQMSIHSRSPTPNLPSTSSGSNPITQVVKPVAKRKRQDDALDRIAAAIAAPVDIRPKQDTWTVSEEVKNFCKFLGNRLNEMSKHKLRKVEMSIMNVLEDMDDK